jgi:GNAT superfamily N-acetyltransferase
MMIRDIKPEDYAQLAELLSLSRGRPFSIEQLKKAGRGLKIWHTRVAVQVNDCLVGTCALSQGESDGNGRYQLHIDVHPDKQRQGIGTALYQDAVQFAQANGLTSLYSYVYEKLAGGLDFARKHGFVSTRQAIHSELDVVAFDEQPFTKYLLENEANGYKFTTLADLGDNLVNRNKLYELNKTCSADIPGRGPFFTFSEYCQRRFESQAYAPNGVILALHDEQWVGMSAATYHQTGNFVFNEMTGVLPTHRRRGLAVALKLLVIRFAQTMGATVVRTFNDAENTGMLAVNRRLGYQFLPSSYTMELKFNDA